MRNCRCQVRIFFKDTKIKTERSKRMKVEELSLSAIKPYERNPRKNDEAVNGVAESIKKFGFQQPIVVDKNSVIVVGHTRYKAA